MTLNGPPKISVEVASNLKCYNNLGREGYMREIRAHHISGIDILPSWKKVRSFEESITPQIQQLPDGLGVEYNYKDAIEMTVKGIFKSLNNIQISEDELILEVEMR